MKKIGIICEFNPFHYGHAEMIRRVRERFSPCSIVCVMSGSFVQRGECAVYPKYLRAEAAVREGADLVLELPYPWSCSTADSFARGALSILDRVGVDVVCFGSESGDLIRLEETARRMESDEYAEALQSDSDTVENESHVRRCRRVYEKLYGEGFPIAPNDILAVSYLRALSAIASRMTPHVIHRTSLFSAGRSRAALRLNDKDAVRSLIPPSALAVFSGCNPVPALLPSSAVLSFFRLLGEDAEEMCAYDGMSPGLPSRMHASAMDAGSTEEMISSLTSKRDTAAKIRRSILACMLGTRREALMRLPAFTLLLAAGEQGRLVLRDAKKMGRITVLTRPAEGKHLTAEAAEQFSLSLRSEYLYDTVRGAKPSDVLRRGPFVLE